MSSILGALFQNQQNNWLKGALINQLNTSNAQNQFGIGQAMGPSNGVQNAANNLINLGSQFSFGAPGSDSGGAFTQLNDRLNAILGGINPSQFQQNGLSQLSLGGLGDLQGTAASLNPQLAMLAQVLQNGGQTPQSSYLGDRLTEMGNGQGFQQGILSDIGTQLMTNPGNPFTSGAQSFGLNTLNNGGATNNLTAASDLANNLIGATGMTPQLGNLSGYANAVLAGRGMTPYTQGGMQTALQGFQNGGATPFLQGMQGLGFNLASHNPVLPTGMVAGIARDQAAQNEKNAAENFRAQALARGGGPGATVANGTSNEAMADFADQGANSVSQALQNALLAQQGLGLQEQGLGASMGLGGAGTQASQLGTYGGDLANLAGVTNQLFGIGGNLAANAADQGSQNLLSAGGLLPTVQNSSNSLMGMAGNLGLGAGQLNLSNLQEGGNLMNNYNQTRLQAMNGLDQLLANQNSLFGTAGSLYNSGVGTQGNLYGNALNSMISGDQLGMNQANNYYGNLGNFTGQAGNVANAGLGLINSGINPLNTLAGNWMNYGMNGLNLQKGLFSDYQPTSALGNLFNGGGVGNMLTGALGLG